MKSRTIPIVYLIILIFYACTPLQAEVEQTFRNKKSSIDSYFLPANHPLQGSLKILFQDPHMFLSPLHFGKAGFTVKLGHRGLMVGFHPSIPQFLIKKFVDKMPQSLQLDNYTKRIEGANILRRYIKKHQFKHLVVPKKYLYKLPKRFFKDHAEKTYVLVVENMDIYDDWDDPNGEARRLYYEMDKEMLTELCTVLYEVGGCDAFPRNQPFTRSGKIAFIDTEHVGLGRFHDYFVRHIVPALNEEMQAYALALWSQLEEENKKNKKKRF